MSHTLCQPQHNYAEGCFFAECHPEWPQPYWQQEKALKTAFHEQLFDAAPYLKKKKKKKMVLYWKIENK